jgi:putative aminopeptidase FrvX
MLHDLLFELLKCHATPGDEDEVAVLLKRAWQRAGLTVAVHGRYAVSARGPVRPALPTLLVCAHMDSPGFTVEEIHEEYLKVIPLGGAHFEAEEVPAVLKTAGKRIEVRLRKDTQEERPRYYVHGHVPARHGDRLCYAAQPQVKDDIVSSPFLDNRLGCFIVAELARLAIDPALPCNVVLAATAFEEMGGYGAPVLAKAVQPDAVICLDATYASDFQKVVLGGGPVLTLSDTTVNLGEIAHSQIRQFFDAHRLPLQTEVYNTSGTDAKAFPMHGLPGPVLALLFASTGNHTHLETASLNDLKSLMLAVEKLAMHGGPLFRNLSF